MAQRWAAQEKERRAAAAADRARAEAERSPAGDSVKPSVEEPEASDRAAFLLGLVFLMFLAILGWFLIDAMRCNPLFAKIGFAQARACR